MARKSRKGSTQRRRSGGKGASGSRGAAPKGAPKKGRSSGARRKRSNQPALSFRALAAIWFAAGVALGLLILVPIYFASGGGSGGEPEEPRARGGETPDYRFYDILPHARVRPPEPEAPEEDAEREAPEEGSGEEAEPAEVPEDGRYFLQVASFQNRPDAERTKAQLALQGLQARIVSAEVPGKGTWHRVRLGPFGPERLGDVEGQLRDAGIQPMRLRAGDS